MSASIFKILYATADGFEAEAVENSAEAARQEESPIEKTAVTEIDVDLESTPIDVVFDASALIEQETF